MTVRIRLRIVSVELLALFSRLFLVVEIPIDKVNLGKLDRILGPFIKYIRRILIDINPDYIRNLSILYDTLGGGGIYVRL